jgi:hypothetical protein
MRRVVVFAFFLLTGCSTAPVAGFMDCVLPTKSASEPEVPPLPDRSRIPPPDLDDPIPPPRGPGL